MFGVFIRFRLAEGVKFISARSIKIIEDKLIIRFFSTTKEFVNKQSG